MNMDIYLISHCSRKIYTPFFRRKVCQRTLLKKHHFFSEAFEIQKDFSRKVLWSRFGAEAPTDNTHKKHGIAVLFIFHQYLELRSKPCFKRLFEKSPLKIRKNFSQIPHFTLAKLLRFQRTFREKSFVSGFGADSPN